MSEFQWFRWKYCGDLPQYEKWTKWHILKGNKAGTACGTHYRPKHPPCGQQVDHDTDPPPPDKRCKRCARRYGFEVE